MGDTNFIKLHVCVHNNWNMNSKEVKQIPEHQWVLDYVLINLKRRKEWEEMYKNNSELTASIIKPENFKQYREYQDKVASKTGKGESVDTKVGDTSYAVSNSRFDPEKGLVDANGNVLIPKDRFNDMLGFDGVAVSY